MAVLRDPGTQEKDKTYVSLCSFPPDVKLNTFHICTNVEDVPFQFPTPVISVNILAIKGKKRILPSMIGVNFSVNFGVV